MGTLKSKRVERVVKEPLAKPKKKTKNMIGYFGEVIFETNDRRICTFNNMKRTVSASYSEHKPWRKTLEDAPQGGALLRTGESLSVCYWRP